MSGLPCKQKEIVELPLEPICVTACAGSGKTRTAVHRLWEMRRRLEDRHGVVALLSFSNIAVDTFRKDYYAFAEFRAGSSRTTGVEIDTVDGFITGNILRPHAHRTMGASRTAYLVQGREPFLANYKVFDGQMNHPIASLNTRIVEGSFTYSASFGNATRPVDVADAEIAIVKFGKTGAYTHALGRYWTLRTLNEQNFVLRALARRYPHILIDEAQDIASEHQAILELLMSKGVQVSMIGDTNQGIFEFTGADGKFLETFGKRFGIVSRGLTENFRSVPEIVALANNLSGRSDTAAREALEHLSGALIVTYKGDAKDKLLAAFAGLMAEAKTTADKAVIICRGGETVEAWRGADETQGQGTVRVFVDACLERDKHGQYHSAFKLVCEGIVALLAYEHSNLLSLMSLSTAPIAMRRAKRLLWGFMRDPTTGLPACTLRADTDWHTALIERIKRLLEQLESECGLKKADNIGNKLAKKKLTSSPISQASATGSGAPKCKVTTVHRVKGESIEAVMYVATKRNIRDLLRGTGSEEGRIGYVAVTRARNLFVLAVPENCLAEFEEELLAKGFRKAAIP